MISEVRQTFNDNFTESAYQKALDLIDKKYPGDLVFKIAETPVFLPEELVKELQDASKIIIAQLQDAIASGKMNAAIPKHHFVPGDEGICEMFSLDFGICEEEDGNIVPRLIELQGFPTMFYFQEIEAFAYHEAYAIDDSWTNFFSGYDVAQYETLLRKLILHGLQPEEVILLELQPAAQKTRIDFTITAEKLGIPVVCISDVFEEDGNVFYMKNEEKQQVKRIYNRMIFDDFEAHKHELKTFLDITKPLNVEWCPHPNWFYKISKYSLPFLLNEYVPETRFLNEVKQIPTDLENYVLKPLFSFAGQGVVIDVTIESIQSISDPENWILQKKVQYAPIVKTLDVDAVVEIRLMFFWDEASKQHILVNNLARLSKGKMVGVRYNADKSWVGSSIAFHKEGVKL
ncbi:MAG: hypothetical protein DI598_16405 [Pseudopedobacter saltans]|uniref:Circularly permuted ATPgrasp domain-containing protein n=1 Tax=Pseudopedobacter saltans TaxID=151895 RepID=A0A2W5GLG1_9SPHI|nr:MAG: hypothetical protein DI598_16405 [Pseudopedobacter saltans]